MTWLLANGRSRGEIIRQTSESSTCQLLSAIRGAAQQFLTQPRANRRRAIVVVTDDQGAGTAPRLVQDTVHNLWKADVVVLGVIVHSGNTTISLGPPHRGARYAAEVTGGDTLSTDDAVEGLREIIRRLRLRYSKLHSVSAALGKATPTDSNNLAWDYLVDGNSLQDAIDIRRKSITHLTEARQTILQAIKSAAMEEPNDAAW